MSITRFKFAPAVVAAVLLTVAFVAESAGPSFAQHARGYGAPSPSKRRADIRLPEMPAAVGRLKESVRRPEDIDGATTRLGIEPRLLNFNLATPVDLSHMGLGKAVQIPVQISNRDGGRKSLYFLQPGEEVMAGIFVTDDGVALRNVKRLTGGDTPARSGDTYETRVTTTQGETIYREQGRLEVLDPKRGIGRFVPVRGDGQVDRQARTSIWYFWSCIYVQNAREDAFSNARGY
jgi:hypothetical protein